MYHQGQHLQASYNRYKSQTTNLEEHLFPCLGTSVSYRRCGSWLTFPKQRSVFIHSFLESGVTFFGVRPHNLEYIITISGASLVLNIHILASFFGSLLLMDLWPELEVQQDVIQHALWFLPIWTTDCVF